MAGRGSPHGTPMVVQPGSAFATVAEPEPALPSANCLRVCISARGCAAIHPGTVRELGAISAHAKPVCALCAFLLVRRRIAGPSPQAFSWFSVLCFPPPQTLNGGEPPQKTNGFRSSTGFEPTLPAI